jgi:4-hydroxysphinganine ceramide fatty acyl 2-hydroxylase
LFPTWFWLGFKLADGLTVGVMAGYWWYGVVHHVVHHHANSSSPSYFNDLRAWHMRHHYSPKRGNFGVTTPIWDYVFGTTIRSQNKATASP